MGAEPILIQRVYLYWIADGVNTTNSWKRSVKAEVELKSTLLWPRSLPVAENTFVTSSCTLDQPGGGIFPALAHAVTMELVRIDTAGMDVGSTHAKPKLHLL